MDVWDYMELLCKQCDIFVWSNIYLEEKIKIELNAKSTLFQY